MKTWKIFILVAVLAATVAVFNSCRAQQEVVEEKDQPVVQEVEKPKLAIWTQDKDENIAVGDPIMFYNQYKIVVVGKISIKIKGYVDGKFCEKDSSINFDYSIPEKTKGKLVKVELKSGKPFALVVQFDEEDTNYKHRFLLKTNKTFCVSSSTIVNVEGQNYPVNLGIIGDGTGMCALMYDSNYSNSESTTGRPATGVQDILGTKIIKKQ